MIQQNMQNTRENLQKTEDEETQTDTELMESSDSTIVEDNETAFGGSSQFP